MKVSPKYRFFRVIEGGELLDIDIFQYPNKTMVIISMLVVQRDHIIMVTETNSSRSLAIQLARNSFIQSKRKYEKKFSPQELKMNEPSPS